MTTGRSTGNKKMHGNLNLLKSRHAVDVTRTLNVRDPYDSFAAAEDSETDTSLAARSRPKHDGFYMSKQPVVHVPYKFQNHPMKDALRLAQDSTWFELQQLWSNVRRF